MSLFTITLLTLFIFLALITLLHIRFRLVIQSGRKTLFVGLGRTGILTNFAEQTRTILIAGRTIKTTLITKKKKQELEKKEPAKKSRRVRPFSQVLGIIPGSLRAVTRYLYSLVKATIIEELEVELNAGFNERHLTGMAYGYYQAAMAAVPAIGKRIKFTPNWTGASISGGFRTSVSIPFYKIIYRTIVVLFQLPLRKLIKLAIGRKDRNSNVTAK